MAVTPQTPKCHHNRGCASVVVTFGSLWCHSHDLKLGINSFNIGSGNGLVLLSQCWLRSMWQYGVTRPRWGNLIPHCFQGMYLHFLLTHWGQVMHICISKLTIIGLDNGLLPDRHQAIIWTNAGILLIGPLGTKFSEILIKILTFLFNKMRFKVSSAKWRPFCLGLNVLT